MQVPGIDIVEIDRLDNIRPSFVDHVLSRGEKELYVSFSPKRAKEFLGGRFAAKEAIIKCLSGIEVPNMRDIEILNDSSGKPCVNYRDYHILVSISHETHYAVAVALLEV